MPKGVFARKPILKQGARYGRLTVVRLHHKGKRWRQFWLFKCDCGNEKVIDSSHVKTGNTKSCGCLHSEGVRKMMQERKTHGMTKSREYVIWRGVKARCLNKKSTSYKYYGARGIGVCDRWKESFENFYDDMGDIPKGKILDRINSNGDYEPKNCRIVTWKEQENNRRNNRLLTFNGKTLNLTQWSEKLGIHRSTIESRYSRGCDAKDILTPVANPSLLGAT